MQKKITNSKLYFLLTIKKRKAKKRIYILKMEYFGNRNHTHIILLAKYFFFEKSPKVVKTNFFSKKKYFAKRIIWVKIFI